MSPKEMEVIYTIREYENSVEMPDDERVTYLDFSRRPHLKDGDASAPEYLDYAKKCSEYLRFGDEVDDATVGAMPHYEQIKVCETPDILIAAGLERKPMLYTQKHLEMALHPKSIEDYHWHGLSVPLIKRLPELLEKPVLLADSPSRDDAFLAVLCATDGDSLPLITAIKPDGHGTYRLQNIETNFILSVYGKDEFDLFFKQRISSDKVFYYDTEKGMTLERLAGIQFPEYYSNIIPNVIIRPPECIRNSKMPDRGDNFSSHNSLLAKRDEIRARRDVSLNEQTHDCNLGHKANRDGR